MNQELAETVKHLAKSCHEAMQVIGGKKCPKCEGKGYSKWVGHAHKRHQITCTVCNGMGRIKYAWEPQVGECILLDDEIHLLFPTRDGLGFDAGISCGRSTDYCEEKCYQDFTDSIKAKCTPILPWEEIMRIMEKAGYRMSNLIRDVVTDHWVVNFQKLEWQGPVLARDVCVGTGQLLQEAVMLAVIELGKELKNA